MTKYLYSAKTNGFYPEVMRDIYTAAGVSLDDATLVDEEDFIHFSGVPPTEKIRVAGENGLPAWGGIPPLSLEQQIAAAELLRQSLLSHADSVTADWRTELSLGEISDSDKAQLSAWMAYKRYVKAISAETAIAPGFKWPEQPKM